MNKVIRLTLSIALVVLLLVGCGKVTFTCAVCMREVTERPNQMTILGQTVKVCDSCHEGFEALASFFQ